MANCAIVGINWGDEGKGRMVDYLTGQYDVVVRYQGGGNAGHTVINDRGKFALHLLPSGIFRPGVMNILGNGVALDCENLVTEMETIRSAGVGISPENLLVSHRASLLLPWHRELDALEEARLKDKMYGSTKQGIAPFYSDKYQKKTIQAGELLYPAHLKAHLQDLLEWKNLILQRVYGAKGYTLDELLAWLDANHIPMAVASSSRIHVIEGNLNNWGLTHYFKALVSGQQVKHSKPDPEIFLLAAEKLGTDPAHTLVLEDSYNGVRAGAAGGFVTVMVPDLLPADDEMRGLYTMECTSLNEVLAKLKTGEL